MKKSNKGFTLMEMLIVVAIIAILVAIAIPVFNNALSSAKKAADDANLRSATAIVLVDAMTKKNSLSIGSDGNVVGTPTYTTPTLQFYKSASWDEATQAFKGSKS